MSEHNDKSNDHLGEQPVRMNKEDDLGIQKQFNKFPDEGIETEFTDACFLWPKEEDYDLPF